MMTRIALSAAALGAAALFIFPGCAQQEPTPKPAEQSTAAEPARPAEQPAPAAAAALPAIDTVDADKIAAMLEAAKGKVVVINLWATWCPPCVEEMPYFVTLYKNYADKPLSFISISCDGADTIDKAVKPFQKDHALPFPIHVLASRDPAALTEALQKEMSGALPETLIYSKDGTLKKAFEGGVTLEDLEAEIKPLL